MIDKVSYKEVKSYHNFPENRVVKLPEFQEYSDIFEKDARWIMGKHLINQIVSHVTNLSLEVTVHPDDPSTLQVMFPVPEVRNITGEMVPIVYWVPDTLEKIFDERAALAVSTVFPHIQNILDQFIGQFQSRNIVAAMNYVLFEDERVAVALGDGPFLHEIIAHVFGIAPFVLKRKL